MLRERLGRRTPIAAVVALGGLALLVAPWRAPVHGATAAAWFGAASGVFYASTVLCGKRIMVRFSPIEITVYHALVAAALLAPLAARDLAAAPARGIGLLVVAALVLGLGAGWAFFRGLSAIPAPHAGVLTYLEPLVAVVVGAVAFGEQVALVGAIGGVLIVAAGIAVVTES